MKRLIWSLRRIFIQFITHLTLTSYLFTIFLPTIASAGTFEISFEHLKEPTRLVHNQEFEHQLGKVLQKRISEAKEVRAGAGALGGVAGYESDGDARSVDSGYVSDSTRSIMTARKPRGAAGYESEDGYASDASELSQYGAGSERHLKATRGAPHKVQRVSFKYKKGDKEVWNTRTIFTGQESFKVMGDHGCLEFAIVDGQVHLKSFKGPELKVKSPRLEIHIDRHASILADRVSIASRTGVLNGRIEGGNVQWSGLEAEPYGSRAQLMTALDSLKESAIRLGLNGRSLPLSSQVYGDSTLYWGYCHEKGSYPRVDPKKLYNGLTLEEYIKANPPKKPQPQPLDLKIGSFGAMTAEDHIKLDNVGSITSSGYVHSDGDLHITATNLENHGTMSGQGDLRVVATKIDNSRGTIRGQGHIEVGAQEMDNQDGKIEGKNLTVKTHVLNNERGKIVGAKSTNVIMGRTDISTPSTFKNLLGEIGAIGSKTILRFLTQAAVTTLGVIRGFKIHIADESASDTLKLQDGIIESMALRPEAGGAVEYGSVHIQAKGFHAPEVKFLVDTLYAKVTDLHLGTQDSLRRLVIKVPATGNYNLTHPIRTAGTLEFWEEDFTREDEVQEAMERIYGKDGLVEASATHTIHINADVQAKDLRIFAPHALLRFGEQKEGKPIPTIDLPQGNLTAYVNTFDLENAVLAALNAFVQAPMGIRIGRLVRDKTRDVLPELSRHWKEWYGWKVEDPILHDLIGQTDGHHRAPVPGVVKNNASFIVKHAAELKGPLYHHGTLDSKDLILEASKDSILEGSLTIIRNNLSLRGIGNILLKAFKGKIKWDALWYNEWIYGWFEYLYPLSDPANMHIGGKLDGNSVASIINEGSILHAHEKSNNIEVKTEHFDTYMHRSDIGLNRRSRGDHQSIFSTVLNRTINSPVFKPLFHAQTSYGSETVLPSTTTALTGFVSAPLMLIPVGAGGLAIGSRNPYYIPPKSPIADLMAKPFNAMSVTMHQDLHKVIAAAARPQFHFKVRERFWFDDVKDQAFCEDIKDHQVVLTKHGVYRKLDTSVFTLSPKLLVDRVRDACKETLMRGYVEHGKEIDDEYVKELHRNATEYLRSVELDAGSFALVLASKGGTKTPLPTKPLIYYEEVMNEQGVEELTAKVFFPPAMIEEVRTKNNGHIHTKVLGIFPEGMSPIQLLECFKSMPTVCRQVAKLLLPDELVHLYLEDAPTVAAVDAGATSDTTLVPAHPSLLSATGGTRESPSTALNGGAVDIYADISADHIAIVAADALRIHGASLKGNQTVFLASLNDMVSVISEKKRLYAGNRMWEVLDRRASIVAEQIYIYAGKDILLQGVETKSVYDTYIDALGNIYNIPVELIWKTIHDYKQKKKWVHEEHSGTTLEVSRNTAGGDIITRAGGSVFNHAPVTKARNAYIEAGDMAQIADAQEMVTHSTTVSGKGGFWGRSIKSNATSTTIMSKAPIFDLTGNLYVRGRNVALTNPMIRATKTIVDTIDGAGEVLIAMGKRIYTFTDSLSRSSTWWQTSKGGGESHQSYVPLDIEGEFEVNADRVTVQEKPGLPLFSNRIKLLRGETIHHYLTDIHHAQAMSHTGPTSTTCALVAIGVGIATMGTLGPAVAGAMGAAEGGIAAAAISAGVGCVASQYAVNMASTRGDVSASAKALTTRESLRSTAVAMGTAGIARGLGKYMKLQSSPTGFEQHARHAAVHATAGAVSSVVIGGEDYSSALEYAARGMVASTIGGMAANEIGGWYGANQDMYWGHKFAHFGLGGLMGAIQYGEDGILGGAIGAMAAEMAMEAMVDRDAVTRSAAREASESMERIPYEERLTIDPITKRALFYDAARSEVQTQRDLSHFLGAAAGALAGGHVGAASLTASNAVDHNFLFLLALGGIALEGISLYDAYEEDGIEGAVQQFRRDREIVLAMGGAPVPMNGIKVVGKYGKRVYGAVKGLGRAGAGTEAVAGGAGVVKAMTGGAERAVATLSKEQPWTVRPGQEWKLKIIGRAQKTGTEGHDIRSYREAIAAAKRDDVEKVFLNRGIRKASGHPIARPNTRPDVTIVDASGRLHQIEVPSKTDDYEVLWARMDAAQRRLPEHMRGRDRLSEISGGAR